MSTETILHWQEWVVRLYVVWDLSTGFGRVRAGRQLADGSERSRPGFLIRGRMTARLWVSGRVPYISDIWLIDWLIDWLRPCQSTPTNGHRFTALSPPRRSPIQPRARRYSTSVTDSPSKHWSNTADLPVICWWAQCSSWGGFDPHFIYFIS